ncbi:MAG TPA: hypothetical protein VFK06_22785 [Candidatus Angelobacter sp.]|nr:hypothetical protein [Candidatus Angelobacter sp.]
MLDPRSHKKLKEISGAGAVSLEQELQALSARYFQRCLELPLVHEKHTTLVKLYAGTKKLHQAVREGKVADAIFEIGSTLIGYGQMALLLTQEQWNSVAFIGAVGLDLEQLKVMQKNAKKVIEEASMGSVYIQGGAEKVDCLFSSLGITACVPLWLDATTRGAIAFFKLLPQGRELDLGDRELLKLLNVFAGPCLAARKSNGSNFTMNESMKTETILDSSETRE